jgi:hypothetical protein
MPTEPEPEALPSRVELLGALRAVHEAIDIPHAATVSEQEKRDTILIERCGHAVVMLHSLLAQDAWADCKWSTVYLRARLAEHSAEGYKTWDKRVAELEATRQAEAMHEALRLWDGRNA